jgi:hypothetical protein
MEEHPTIGFLARRDIAFRSRWTEFRINNVLPEGFVLPGNLVRLQVVQQQSNPVLWRLLKRFGEEAPAPLLVNTSFNRFGEPLVVTPRDAVRSYFCSGIDALVIDNFVLSKTVTKILPASLDFARAFSA